MPQSSLFNWRDGAGWLVLAGGGDFRADDVSEVDSAVLRRTVSHSPLAYVWSAGDIETADRHLEYLADMGGRTGYLMDALTEHDPAILRQLSEAGIILLADGDQAEKAQAALRGDVLNAIIEAYNNGATLYAVGRMAAAVAAWMPVPSAGLKPALSWLHNSVIAAPYDVAQADQLKTWLRDVVPNCYGLGIGTGSALALSPYGEVEVWGAQQVTILLGKNLTPP